MTLTSLDLKGFYDSDIDSLLMDFYIPALAESLTYRRIAGYFSSNSLAISAKGLSKFINNGGKIKLIANVVLSEDDQDTIKRAILQKEKEILSEIETMEDAVKKSHLMLLSWLLKHERLEIKIAKVNKGIEHKKKGILQDFDGNIVSFSGSDNETVNGWLHNHEDFHVFCSWIAGDFERHLKPDIESFEKLWNNETNKVQVYPVSEAFKNGFIENAPQNAEEFQTLSNEMYQKLLEEHLKTSNAHSLSATNKKKLYHFQSSAIEEFKSNNYRHFFEMATGTGKTFTAVHALKELVENVPTSFTVILVPLIDLQEQWVNELKYAGFSDIQLIGGPKSPSDWSYVFNQKLLDYIEGTDLHIIYVAVYDSFFSKITSKIQKIENLFIIVDEAHNLSTNQLEKMPNNAIYRLGLSATPEKHGDTETENILKYFLLKEQVSYKYTIEDAINSGFLSRYYYYPIFTYLNDAEFSDYIEYSKKIAVMKNIDPINKEALESALRERSLIVKKAEGKIAKLREMISSSEYNFCNSVVYCGQGKYGNTDQSLINVVTKAFGDSNYIVSTYTSQTENRAIVLEEFKNRFYDVLVAIKCFDEGIDVPQLDKIFIMSSDSLIRQTVQRRGRVLRVCKESGKQFAHIYDMIVLPPLNYSNLSSVQTLIQNEMHRVNEYNILAENRLENYTTISKLIADTYSFDISIASILENENEDDIDEYC